MNYASKNREAPMKSRISLFLLIIVLAALSAPPAWATNCSNSTIRGSYAFTIHGQVLPPDGSLPLLVHGLAVTTFDGEGNLIQLDAVAINGNVAPGWRASTGTYSVNRDCTGSMTVSNGDQPPIHLQLIVSQSGNKIRNMVIDPGIVTTAEAERIRVPKD
jgi:hypothetical protein